MCNTYTKKIDPKLFLSDLQCFLNGVFRPQP